MCWDNKFSIPPCVYVCVCKYMLKILGLTHFLKSNQALEIFFLIGLRTFQYSYHLIYCYLCIYTSIIHSLTMKKKTFTYMTIIYSSVFVTALNDETLLLITEQILYEFSIPLHARIHTHCKLLL